MDVVIETVRVVMYLWLYTATAVGIGVLMAKGTELLCDT